MRKLLNTLYVMSTDKYLSLDGENIVISVKQEEIGRIPLHNLGSIVTCGYAGVSPALMGVCAERLIDLCFISPYGKFLARVTGSMYGNVVLRKEQYEHSVNKIESLGIAKSFILGKLYNSRWVIERATRDYPLRVDVDKLKKVTNLMQSSIVKAKNATFIDELRGIEGEAASMYFSVFNDLILQQKTDFVFDRRNKRPPLDKVNALLSLSYSILATMCASALEIVGLDPYVGYMHTDRPGRMSLALDLMEELRSVFADRFVLTIINKKMVTSNDFQVKENGAVLLNDEARKVFFTEWQNKKKEEIMHPFLNEKVEWGMVPFVQALLLARYMRGDIDKYPPLFWK